MGLRKREVTFLTCFRKRGVPRKRGFPQKRGTPTLEETMACLIGKSLTIFKIYYTVNVFVFIRTIFTSIIFVRQIFIEINCTDKSTEWFDI